MKVGPTTIEQESEVSSSFTIQNPKRNRNARLVPTFAIMDEITREIIEALHEKRYRRCRAKQPCHQQNLTTDTPHSRQAYSLEGSYAYPSESFWF